MSKNHLSQKTGNISVIISIMLVLIVLGIVGLFVINTHVLTNYVKENVGISIFLKSEVSNEDAVQFAKLLNISNYAKSAILITKEEAALNLEKEIGGEKIIGFLGFNPLSNVIELRLKSDYTTDASIVIIEKQLSTNNLVKEIFYQKNVLASVVKNTRTIIYVLLIFCFLLSIVAVGLIHHAIRLNIYAKRVQLKIMQMVGATQGFIFKPFILKSILNALIGGLLAILITTGIVYYLYTLEPQLVNNIPCLWFIYLTLLILVFGFFMSFISTWIALKKYTKLSFDDIYLR